MVSRRGNLIGTSVLVVALVATLLVAIVRSEGFRETRVDLHDGAVWVSRSGFAGRVNLQARSIEVKVADKEQTGTDVIQAGTVAYIHNPGAGSLKSVDGATGTGIAQADLPSGATAQLAEGRGMIADVGTGRVWLASADGLASIDTEPDGTEPTYEPETEAESVAVLDAGGRAHLYPVGSSKLLTIEADGTTTETEVEPFKNPTITAVGDKPVLLDESGKIQVPGRGAVSLSAHGTDMALQAPGPGSDGVLVATEKVLMAVPLGGGEPKVLVTGGASSPAPPVRVSPPGVASCSYGAWSSSPRWARWCDGDSTAEATPFAEAQGTNRLRFRVNRGRVVLNDTQEGKVLPVDEQDPEVIDNWNEALDDEQDPEDDVETKEKQKPPPCPETITKPPTAKDDSAGTRPDRPVIVAVTDNDESLDCDVLVVKLDQDDLPPSDVAQVKVVDGGSAIQVTPLGNATTVEVPHTVVGRGGATPSNLTVSVTPNGRNSPPEAVADKTVVQAGQTVQHNVLLNDIDDDGDALTLVGVSSGDRGANPRFEANGRITYTAPGGATGMETLTYKVIDHHSGEAEPSEGELQIEIKSGGTNQPPKARNDRLVATVGIPTSVDVLANDTDANGDELTLVGIDEDLADGLEATWKPDGTVTVTPTAATGDSQVWFSYQVSDGGEAPVEGWVMVEVREEGHNSPPVAVRDDVVVRPSVSALVDLVANDIDDDGDVLAVTGIEVPDDISSDVTVEVLEMRVARITTASALTEPAVIRYSVSDGQAEDRNGRLVIRPLIQSIDNQAPIARDDSATVRPGKTTSVAVMRNDVDPEGEQLTITGARVLDEAHGTAFVQGDHVRFKASGSVRGNVVIEYDIEDPHGDTGTGKVRVEIIDPSRDNQPPEAPSVEGRVLLGSETTMKVPLTGLDPDGDVVGITGFTAENPAKLGTVTVDGGSLRYQARDGRQPGVDTFSFEVSDSNGAKALGWARVVVVAAPDTNSPPVAVPDRITISAGASRVVPVLANDRDLDEDDLFVQDDEVEGPSTPMLGTVEVTADRLGVEYTAPRASEMDRPIEEVAFSYGVTDGATASRGIVIVEIYRDETANEAPVAVDDHQSPQLAGSGSMTIEVLANDRDVDDDIADLEVELIDPSVGSVDSSGRVTVDVGDESIAFLYRLTDPAGNESVALVSIPVVDDLPPVTTLASFKIPAGETEKLDLAKYIENPMGPATDLKILRELDSTVSGGTVTGIDGTTVTFAAADEHLGDGGFAYLVSNGEREAVGWVRIQVTGTSHLPTMRTSPVSLPAGGTRSVQLRNLVDDPDSDEHTFTLERGSRPGTIDLELTGGTVLLVTADIGARGETTTAEMTVADEGGEKVDFEIAVTVSETEAPPPVANDDSDETNEGEAKTVRVLVNDIDYAGAGLEVDPVLTVVGGGDVGRATTDGQTVTFTPASGWFGTALITYTAVDGAGQRSQANLRIEVFGRPGKPAAPSGETDSHKVSLTWGAPSRNGSPILGYVVETEGGSRETTGSPATAWTVDGLTNGNPYRFRVAALNRVVTSASEVRADEWSDWSPTYTPDAVPEQPGAPSVAFDPANNAGGAGGVLQVSWRPPAVDGTPITEYRVTASPPPAGQPATRTVPAGVTTIGWDGLANGTPYQFRVVAVNGAGPSAASPDSTPQAPAGVPAVVNQPRAERSASAENDAGGYATVSWDRPAANGDSEGLRYAVTISPAPTGGQPQTKSDLSDTTVQWSGLSVRQTYTFTVVASNKAGAAAPSQPSPGVIAEGKPLAPSNPQIRPGNGKVHFSNITLNEEQRRGPGAITYQLQFDTGGWYNLSVDGSGNASVDRANGARVESVQVRACKLGLPGGADRQCTATLARNSANGNSNWVTPFGPPNVVGTATAGTGRIRWAWSIPSGATSSPATSPHEVDYGPGHPRNQTLSVTLNWQGVEQSRTGQAMTADTRYVSWRDGGSAAGQPFAEPSPGGVCGSECRWVDVTVTGFLPSTTYTIIPGTSMEPDGTHNPNFEGCIVSRTRVFTTDSGGNASLDNVWFLGNARDGVKPLTWVHGVSEGSQSDCQARGNYWWFPVHGTHGKITLG